MEHCFVPAEILLPDEKTDLGRWACVACDQFTSEPEYWQQAEEVVGAAPSALRLVLPEVYLGGADEAERVAAIQAAMADYAKTVLTRRVNGFVYLERTQMDGSIRAGLLGAVDLEAYSYEKGSRPVVRPSENTVVERIPPRLRVRRGASLELPHVMMLVDDAEKTLIEPLAALKDSLPKLYEGELMLGGGHIEGWAVEDKALCDRLVAAIDRLGSREVFDAKYPAAAGSPTLTLAVGDGNHSLATAKACWEEIKAALPEAERATHPARWCLAEICNVHSEAIQVEPIHRLLTGTTGAEVMASLAAWAAEKGLGMGSAGEQKMLVADEEGRETMVFFATPSQPLTVGTAEAFVGDFLAAHPAAAVDYIHGADTARALAKKGGVALLMPDFEKSDLFKGVVLGGVLPRKTFSMGHAQEKRYYLECRRITR